MLMNCLLQDPCHTFAWCLDACLADRCDVHLVSYVHTPMCSWIDDRNGELCCALYYFRSFDERKLREMESFFQPIPNVGVEVFWDRCNSVRMS